MSKRQTLLGAAAGLVAGYSILRAWQAASVVSRSSTPLPRDAAAYGATRRRLALAGIARAVAGSACAAYGPLSESLERRTRGAPVWLQPALYAAQVAFVESVLALSVEFVEGRELERRYGLSDQSARSWLSDYAKQQIVGTVVAALLSTLLGAALRRWPRTWPVVASIAAFPLLLVANIAVPIYVLPLFNAYVPLQGPLERRLRSLAARYGCGEAAILRMNMSKQTKKANAFVIGIGRTHRIVVGDTLVENFPEEEIEFVVAHELGHYVAKDTWRFVAAGQISATALIIGVAGALRTATPERLCRPRTLAAMQFLASIFSQAAAPALCAFARSREWAADRFALEATRDPRSGAAAFRRLRDQNMAEDEQPVWYEFLFSTHPSLKARIAALEAAGEESPRLSAEEQSGEENCIWLT